MSALHVKNGISLVDWVLFRELRHWQEFRVISSVLRAILGLRQQHWERSFEGLLFRLAHGYLLGVRWLHKILEVRRVVDIELNLQPSAHLSWKLKSKHGRHLELKVWADVKVLAAWFHELNSGFQEVLNRESLGLFLQGDILKADNQPRIWNCSDLKFDRATYRELEGDVEQGFEHLLNLAMRGWNTLSTSLETCWSASMEVSIEVSLILMLSS